MGWGPPPHPMDLMKYCHIIIYWKWGGRQICTFVGGRGGGGGCGWANHCYSNFAWRVFPVYVPITLFYQFHGVGKGCGGEADLFIFVICTCVGGRGGGVGCGWPKQLFKLFVMKNIFSKCLLYIKLFHQIHGVGGGEEDLFILVILICTFGGWRGGGGGVGWDEEYCHYMIILQCFIKFIYSLWRGLTMCTVVSQFMVSKLILNFFQFVENPYSQNRWLRMAPSRELCSRRTLVRRIQQKLNQVVEIVKRYGLFNDK
jgi:hypothetical protein